MTDTARRFTVHGRVQGVFFRDSTRREAERLGISGHAINLPTSVFDSVRALTATIAAELGETAEGSEHYQALFTLGILLFAVTFVINLAADIMVRGRKKKKA